MYISMRYVDFFTPSIDDPVGDAARYERYREMDAQTEHDEMEEKLELWELKEKLKVICGKF